MVDPTKMQLQTQKQSLHIVKPMIHTYSRTSDKYTPNKGHKKIDTLLIELSPLSKELLKSLLSEATGITVQVSTYKEI